MVDHRLSTEEIFTSLLDDLYASEPVSFSRQLSARRQSLEEFKEDLKRCDEELKESVIKSKENLKRHDEEALESFKKSLKEEIFKRCNEELNESVIKSEEVFRRRNVESKESVRKIEDTLKQLRELREFPENSREESKESVQKLNGDSKATDPSNPQRSHDKDPDPSEYFSRQLGTTDGIRELLEELREPSHQKKSPAPPNGKLKETEERILQCLQEKLQKRVTELLGRSPADYEGGPAAREVRELEGAYRGVTEAFLALLTGHLRSVRRLRLEVVRTLRQFRLASRLAAKVTLGTSVANVSLVLFSAIAQRVGDFCPPWLLPRVPLVSNVVAGLTVTASLLTLSYMTQTTNDVARDMRRERGVLLDLLMAHRKGDSVDQRVQRLFPFGIDLDLVVEKALSDGFESRYSWKKYLSSSIILSNVRRDVQLLDSEEFLTRVKLFVESPAAEIWWSRMKIRRLLESANAKARGGGKGSFLGRGILSGHESYASRTARCLYPLVLPWLVSSWRGEETRCLCSLLAGAVAAQELRSDDRKELRELKAASDRFDEDFRDIEAICEGLDSNDD